MANNKWKEMLLRRQSDVSNTPIPALNKVYNAITSDPAITQVEVGPLNKLWRAKILLNRERSPMEKRDDLDSRTIEKPKTTNDNRKLRDEKLKGIKSEIHGINYLAAKETKRTVNNQVIIINTHTSPITKVILQAFSNVEVNPDSTWAVVKSMGRNNPFYMFTGSEDTITFEISWYALDTNREDVINKCRLLESWTKANGYSAAPPTLGISWGNSDMFADDYFILKSAPYKLNNFQNSYRKGPRKGANEIIDLKLYPNSATQTLTFNRVSSNNRTHEDIIPVSKLKTTRGVKFE